MPAYTTIRSIENAIDDRIERERWMQWRIRRYGRPCLTEREYEALVLEVEAMQRQDSERAVQQYIANRMGITQGRVSQLLKTAERVLIYFKEDKTTCFWQWNKAKWEFVAPVGRVV